MRRPKLVSTDTPPLKQEFYDQVDRMTLECENHAMLAHTFEVLLQRATEHGEHGGSEIDAMLPGLALFMRQTAEHWNHMSDAIVLLSQDAAKAGER